MSGVANTKNAACCCVPKQDSFVRSKWVAIAALVGIAALIVISGIGTFAQHSALPQWLSHAVGTIGHKGCMALFISGCVAASLILLLKACSPKKTNVLDNPWLVVAVQSGNKESINTHFGDTNVNSLDALGRSLLHYATLTGQTNSITTLIEKGAEVNIRTGLRDGEVTSLHLAMILSRVLPIDLINLLLKYGANPNDTDKYKCTPLHKGVNLGSEEAVKALLTHNANVDAKEMYGLTPLHIACENGRSTMAEVLLTHKANVQAQNQAGQTPLHLACINGDLLTIQVLLKHGADTQAKDKQGLTPIQVAKNELVKDALRHNPYRAS